MGNLSLSRALGDFEFKRNGTLPASKQMITAYPEVTSHASKISEFRSKLFSFRKIIALSLQYLSEMCFSFRG